MNLYEGAVVGEDCKTYGIRPEHVSLSFTDGRWEGKVRHVERLGADTLVYLDVPRLETLVVRVAEDMELRVGMTLWADPDLKREHRFA